MLLGCGLNRVSYLKKHPVLQKCVNHTEHENVLTMVRYVSHSPETENIEIEFLLLLNFFFLRSQFVVCKLVENIQQIHRAGALKFGGEQLLYTR